MFNAMFDAPGGDWLATVDVKSFPSTLGRFLILAFQKSMGCILVATNKAKNRPFGDSKTYANSPTVMVITGGWFMALGLIGNCLLTCHHISSARWDPVKCLLK